MTQTEKKKKKGSWCILIMWFKIIRDHRVNASYTLQHLGTTVLMHRTIFDSCDLKIKIRNFFYYDMCAFFSFLRFLYIISSFVRFLYILSSSERFSYAPTPSQSNRWNHERPFFIIKKSLTHCHAVLEANFQKFELNLNINHSI
jgi:hypothetical protein